jgi:hypothetical protein
MCFFRTAEEKQDTAVWMTGLSNIKGDSWFDDDADHGSNPENKKKKKGRKQ